MFKEPSKGNYNYTLFAGQRVTGIECPAIWKPHAPDYWAFAWLAAQRYVKAPGPIGLAINSACSRDLNQLHIHVPCLDSKVMAALKSLGRQIPSDPSQWSTYTKSLNNHMYRVLYLKSLPSGQQNLFSLLRQHVAASDRDMQYQTLVVAANPGGGFYIMNSSDNMQRGTGGGEELLNGQCK